jgi:SAM-dependent methyltransferase
VLEWAFDDPVVQLQGPILARVTRRDGPSGSWDESYRRYQSDLASQYLIPTLKAWGIELSGKRLLEAGSGNGGCAAQFHRAGCSVTAVEIDERLACTARSLDVEEGVGVETFLGDICEPDCAGLDRGPFDIILLRDVVEHLDDLVGALENLRHNLDATGVMFIVFPPYYSAYGAHQQILPRKRAGLIPYNKLPFIQLLPDSWFAAITRGDTPPHREIARLRDIRLTLRGFSRSVDAAGLAVRDRKHYLVRPTHKLRYGLPVVGASILGRVPVVNELLVTACYCLLETKKPGG